MTEKAVSGEIRIFCRKIERADHGGAERDRDVDGVLHARDVDAVRARAELGVADRGQRQPVARAQADLVAEQKLRIGHQRAADGDHLLLAARERRRRLPRPFRQHREQVVDALEGPRTLAAELAADQEVLLDRERREQPTPFGHERDTTRDDLVRGEIADRHSCDSTIASRRAGMAPAIHLSSVDLPAPLAPITATTSPSATPIETPNSAWKSP